MSLIADYTDTEKTNLTCLKVIVQDYSTWMEAIKEVYNNQNQYTVTTTKKTDSKGKKSRRNKNEYHHRANKSKEDKIKEDDNYNMLQNRNDHIPSRGQGAKTNRRDHIYGHYGNLQQNGNPIGHRVAHKSNTKHCTNDSPTSHPKNHE